MWAEDEVNAITEVGEEEQSDDSDFSGTTQKPVEAEAVIWGSRGEAEL